MERDVGPLRTNTPEAEVTTAGEERGVDERNGWWGDKREPQVGLRADGGGRRADDGATEQLREGGGVGLVYVVG